MKAAAAAAATPQATVLDAYAVVAYLRGETAAGEVERLLRTPVVLCAPNAAEVVDVLVRTWGRDPDDVHGDLALLVTAGMQIEATTADVAILAGRLRARHYHRAHCPVSLGDCLCAAAALASGRPVATADPHLAVMLRAEGGLIHELADSTGKRP